MRHNRNRLVHDHRRSLLSAGGLLGLGILAGCLGDDDDAVADEPDDSDDDGADQVDEADDMDDDPPVADDTDDADDVDDESDSLEAQPQEVYDATLTFTHGDIQHPADQNFHPYGGSAQFPWPFIDSQAKYLVNSWADPWEIHPQLVESYEYQPGILEFTIHEDFYWWSGDQMTIDDTILGLEFANYYWGGDDLDAHDTIVSWERIDELTARYALPDTWHERWALEQTILGKSRGGEGEWPRANRNYYTPWIEQFEDAPTLDDIDDIRTELSETDFITDDEKLVNHFYHPFEFRFADDGYGDVGELHYEFEWVPEKNGNLRHFANVANSDRLANYRYIRAEVVEEGEVWHTEKFLEEQTLPYASYDEGILDDAEFETKIERWAPDVGEFGFQFNHAVHPSDNVHFRRAWAYFTDNTAWESPTRVPPEYHHPFMQDAELELFASEETIEALTQYGWDEHRWEDAEIELETGGFERNGDGDWILTEDSVFADAGEPIFIELQTYGWMGYIGDGATDFWSDLEDFGIEVDIIPDTAAWGVHEDYVVSAEWTGGGSPEHTFTQIFVEPDFRNAYNVPSTIQAPEFLETTGPGASTGDWREYDTEAMTQRLGVTSDADAYQRLVDELTWCANQTIPHFTPSTGFIVSIYNDYSWNFIEPDEYPEKAHEFNFRNVWQGAFNYVPEDER